MKEPNQFDDNVSAEALFLVTYRTDRRSVARNRISGNSINGNLGKQTKQRLVDPINSFVAHVKLLKLSPAIRHHHDAP